MAIYLYEEKSCISFQKLLSYDKKTDFSQHFKIYKILSTCWHIYLLVLIIRVTIIPSSLLTDQYFIDLYQVSEFTDTLEHMTTELIKWGHWNAGSWCTLTNILHSFMIYFFNLEDAQTFTLRKISQEVNNFFLYFCWMCFDRLNCC